MHVTLLALLVPTLTAIAGWLIGHWLNARRNQANRRSNIRVRFLLEAYRKLERSSNRASNSEFQVHDIESAIADIQLLGNQHQAEMAADFALRLAEEREASLDDLIRDLRDDLRRELSLKSLSGRPVHLRMLLSRDRRRRKVGADI